MLSGSRWFVPWSDSPQQPGGGVSGELLPDGVGEKVSQEHVQTVQGAGALGHQILAPLREQSENLNVSIVAVLGLYWGQPLVVQGGLSGECRVQTVVLAGVSSEAREKPGFRGEFGRDIHYLLARHGEPLSHGTADTGGSFHRPATLGKRCPPLQCS